VADLLAGLAAFSRSDHKGFTAWESERSGQEQLFPSDTAAQRSRSDVVRYEVLGRFNIKCKEAKLGVSLASRKCLWTPKPENPINFWWWEPQTPASTPTRPADGVAQVEESGRLREFSPISPSGRRAA
jgi:hypothetical protein